MSLRYYPVELDLRGRPVLMVGGGSVASRKLPELIACGAQVTLVSPEISTGVRRILPGLTWHARVFEAGDVKGQMLAFACTNDPAVNSAVSGAAKVEGIPCNRADAASEGSFIVPGVVRREGVTLSISTSAQVPALTRHLKRKLSNLLGPEWGELAEILAAARNRLPAPDAIPFELLAETLRTQGPDAARTLLENPDTPAASTTVHPVLLVGAGPGSPSLLTVGATEALRDADVVLYDRLASQAVLEAVSPTCLRIPVEKRGHGDSMRQEHINEELIRQARTGKRVVRLKGGDPFVFGRGYEEALALEEAGLPWRVLPGITSSVAVPALAGIPLTHRGVARSFAVASGVAGHEVNTAFPKADTLVLLMALYRLEEIVPHLIRAGYAPETPAAAIQHGSLPEQRVVRATLATLRDEAARHGFESPTLIVVGDVVGLGDHTASV